MKLVLLQNTIFNSQRYVAGDVIDVKEEVAQRFCDNEMAHPLFAADLEKLGMSIDDDAIIDNVTDEGGQAEEPEQEVKQAATNKGKKKGKK